MEKNIVNLTMAVVSMIVPAALTEGAPIAKATESIKIKLNPIVLETNPWLGKRTTMERIASLLLKKQAMNS
jgi:hypothetical protein